MYRPRLIVIVMRLRFGKRVERFRIPTGSAGEFFVLRTRIRGRILGAVPPSLRSCGPLRAAGRPCRSLVANGTRAVG